MVTRVYCAFFPEYLHAMGGVCPKCEPPVCKQTTSFQTKDASTCHDVTSTSSGCYSAAACKMMFGGQSSSATRCSSTATEMTSSKCAAFCPTCKPCPPPPPPPPQPKLCSSSSVTQEMVSVFNAVNGIRNQHGLACLNWSSSLTVLANDTATAALTASTSIQAPPIADWVLEQRLPSTALPPASDLVQKMVSKNMLSSSAVAVGCQLQSTATPNKEVLACYYDFS